MQFTNQTQEILNGLAATVAKNASEGKTTVIKDENGKIAAALQTAANAGKETVSTTVTTPTTPTSGSRNEFMARFASLSSDMQAGLLNGRYQLVDSVIYNTKAIGGQNNIRMFDDADDKIIGVGNISRGKLEKNEVFLLSAIQLLIATAPAKGGSGSDANDPAFTEVTRQNMARLEWDVVDKNVRAGEHTFRAGTQTLLDRVCNEVFAYEGDSHEKGLYKLANPKLIRTQEALDLFIEFAEVAPAGTFLRVVMYGSKVMNK